jgi:hypothetical protein
MLNSMIMSSQTESNHIESSYTESMNEDNTEDPGNLYINASSEAVQVTYCINSS